jgi:hypothetical protein
MKALCVRQPWASLIASGRKTLELRSRHTRYRGPVIICASGKPGRTKQARAASRRFKLDEAPRGVALCIVELVDSREARQRDKRDACCPIDAGDYCWQLRNVRVFSRPMPIVGRLNLFTPPADIVAKVSEELLK